MKRGLVFRTAVEADLDRLVDIHLVAYPDDRGGDVRRRNMTVNAFGGLADLVVAEEDGELRAHARLFRMSSWFGGKKVKVGGIASVAVAPEARGQGIARALVGELHAMSRRRGDAVTLLYPWKQGFYARLGYAQSSSRRRLAIDPSSIPPAWRQLARATVRRVRGEDRPAIERTYARAAARASAWIARREVYWDRLFARERRHHLASFRGKKMTGYVAFELAQEEAHAETRLVVEELAYDDDEARRALWGALGAMRDQIAEIDVEVPEDDGIDHVLVDADRRRHGTVAVEHALGELVAGPMLRLVDLERAIAGRGYAAGSYAVDVVLEPEDGVPGEPGEPPRFTLRISGGRGELGKAKASRDALTTTRRGLAALLYGSLRLDRAVAFGVARCDARVVARLAPLLALPPTFPVDPF